MGVFVNEVGYITKGVKHANVNANGTFCLMDSNGNEVKKYQVNDAAFDAFSGENTGLIDFSDVSEEGTYYFKDENGNESCHFVISDSPYDELSIAALKMFYFQRCGMELTEKYAGLYTHKICHFKPVSYIANKDITFSCNGGWHDAGDFGRYVTAGAVAVAHLLYAYMLNPSHFEETINIPESGNGMPDILNECKYEIDWFLKMQLEDGSVYHKCTSMHHAPFTMPEDDLLPFVVTKPSSIATADFVGVCALASRIYEKFDKEYSETLKAAAFKGYEWLEKNPGLVFEESKECTTGGYGDLCDLDERMWAETELYCLDKDQKHINALNVYLDMHINLTSMGWMDVGGFAALCVLTSENIFPSHIYNQYKDSILDEAERLDRIAHENIYELAMHMHDIKWGSNMVLLTNTMVLCFADYISGSDKYRDTIQFQLDYLLGRNAMDTSYVTGFGDHAFNNPHNRPTASDNIDAAIPGFVSGGPNSSHCDEHSKSTIPEGTAPMKCYVDHINSYSTNEITIYWNSPLVFVLACIAR